MSAHVLLNLLPEVGKRDKMRGLPSISSFFRNEFNKSNNTRAYFKMNPHSKPNLTANPECLVSETRNCLSTLH